MALKWSLEVDLVVPQSQLWMGVRKSPFLLACSRLSSLVGPLLTPGGSPRAVKAALAGLSGGCSQGGALTSSTGGGRDRPCAGEHPGDEPACLLLVSYLSLLNPDASGCPSG